MSALQSVLISVEQWLAEIDCYSKCSYCMIHLPTPSGLHQNVNRHWNVNSLLVHDSEKLSLIEAYNSVYKYDIICICKTFLNSSVLGDSEDVQLKDYKLIGADHPYDLRRGGICIYYREFLAV